MNSSECPVCKSRLSSPIDAHAPGQSIAPAAACTSSLSKPRQPRAQPALSLSHVVKLVEMTDDAVSARVTPCAVSSCSKAQFRFRPNVLVRSLSFHRASIRMTSSKPREDKANSRIET
jgi:hypothetical protein